MASVRLVRLVSYSDSVREFLCWGRCSDLTVFCMPKVCLYGLPSWLNFVLPFRLQLSFSFCPGYISFFFSTVVGHFSTAILGVDLSIEGPTDSPPIGLVPMQKGGSAF